MLFNKSLFTFDLGPVLFMFCLQLFFVAGQIFLHLGCGFLSHLSIWGTCSAASAIVLAVPAAWSASLSFDTSPELSPMTGCLLFPGR